MSGSVFGEQGWTCSGSAHLVFESAADGARARADVVSTHKGAVTRAREIAGRSGRPAFVCQTSVRARSFQRVEAVHPDGTVESLVAPTVAPVAADGRAEAPPSRAFGRTSTRHASLAVEELRAYIAACGTEDGLEHLRSTLQRHLQDDEDVVEHLLLWVSARPV